MYLEELTGSITLENLEVECKARLDRNNPQSWIKTVGGFSNAAGGTFYIGAEDKTFKLIGFTRKDADNERNYFNNQINEHVHRDRSTPFRSSGMRSIRKNCSFSKSMLPNPRISL